MMGLCRRCIIGIMKHLANDPRQKKEDLASFAVFLGSSFALLQHGMDKAIEWGLTKMREIPKESKEQTFENPTLRKVAKAGRGVLRFFGGMGKAYYERYEELKKESDTKKP